VKGLEGTLGKYPTQDTRIACVVNFFGPQNLLTLRDPKTIDRTKAKNYAEALLIGGLVSDHAAVAKEASPVTHISAGDAPFFTAHGTKDLIVPFSQAEELHAELTQAGVPSILQQVTHGGHGFPNAELDKRAKQFLDRHLRGNTVEIVTTPIEWSTGR
jgi:acetyl esterase/lipase